jgi:hypothetical protein
MAKTFEEWIDEGRREVIPIVGPKMVRSKAAMRQMFRPCWHAAQAAQRERCSFLLVARAQHIEMILEEAPDGSINQITASEWRSASKELRGMAEAILADTGRDDR